MDKYLRGSIYRSDGADAQKFKIQSNSICRLSTWEDRRKSSVGPASGAAPNGCKQTLDFRPQPARLVNSGLFSDQSCSWWKVYSERFGSNHANETPLFRPNHIMKQQRPQSTVLFFPKRDFCMDPGTRHEIPRPEAARTL
ncbi:hypothetical protein ASPBRDRAFT_602989 [Aspergillus brasiliensis CBS 101740]|uniref:Uncharacterized protein n=1 Tax=Aspergillus brasiliensis (strain CBS 101740 / IMI 381727 / IBT 21946) TaxID=767769 RepID=A0A1L9UHN4_ASPBC|nr:hypothetical protein ASPBRDRAFT_602989 [Aspergillus brasiliensis CBS 101740]